MPRNALLIIGLVSLLPCASFGGSGASSGRVRMRPYFEPVFNDTAGALFRFRSPGGEILLTRSGVEFRSQHLEMQFEGSSRRNAISGVDRETVNLNYFVGPNPAQWRSGVEAWTRVRQLAIYPGINVEYHAASAGDKLEYDLAVAPNADPSRIILRYAGARSVHVDSHGDLVISTAAGIVHQVRPEAYQDINGKRVPVGVVHRVRGTKVAFTLSAYDHNQPLIIDPVIAYASFLGGEFTDAAFAIATDSEGNAYVTGYTRSPGFPVTVGAIQSSCGTDRFCNVNPADLPDYVPHPSGLDPVPDGDAFVAKISSDGSTLLWATFLGGSGGDVGGSIAVDGQGNVYVGGWTASPDFPVTSHLFTSSKGPATFFAKLDSSGKNLLFSALVPGLRNSMVGGDVSGRGYIAGTTDGSATLPTTQGAAQTKSPGGQAVYVGRVDPAGASLLFGTYLGGIGNTSLSGLQVAQDGSITLAGTTTAGNLPVSPGAAQGRLAGVQNAFVARLDASGRLIACSYLGGSQSDSGVGVSADSEGNIYVAGVANSPDFPVVGGLPNTQNGHGFAAKFTSDGRSLLYSTRLLITPQAATGNPDGTFTVLAAANANSEVQQIDPSGTFLLGDLILPIAQPPLVAPVALTADASGNVYLAGTTFLVQSLTQLYLQGTPGVFQPDPAGESDATIMKLGPHGGSLKVTPSSLVLETLVGRTLTADLTVVSTGNPLAAPVLVKASSDVAWIAPPFSPGGSLATGSSPAHVTITALPDAGPSLPVGVYTGNIFVESPGAENSPVTVPVTLTVNDFSTAYPYAYPVSVHCNYKIGTDSSSATSGDVVRPSLVFGGGQILSTTVVSSGWLTYNASGSGLICDPANLVPGLYEGEVDAVLSSSPSTPVKVPVDFQVTGPPVYARPGSLEFSQIPGDGAAQATVVLTDGGTDLAPTSLSITDIHSAAPWLTASLTSKTLPTILAITASPGGLSPGSYLSSIQLQVADATNPTLTVPVSLMIDPALPFSVNPASLSYQIPSQDMLAGDRTVFIDSPTPIPFQTNAVHGMLIFDVTPTSGVTPATLHVNVSSMNSASASAEDYISITAGGSTRVVPLSLVSSSYSASYVAAGIVSAATFATGPVAPGSIVSIFGSYLSPTAIGASSVPVPTNLADLNIYVGGKPAPIFYAGPNQINVQIPYEVSSGSEILSIQGPHYASGSSVAMVVADSSPGIFTWGQNRAAVLNADESLNQSGNAALPGSFVSVYCTGQGALDHPIATGASAPGDVLARPLLPVTATIGGQPADVQFAGMAPGLVGVCQVNVRVPSLPPGDYPVQIQIGTNKSNAPLMSIGS